MKDFLLILENEAKRLPREPKSLPIGVLRHVHNCVTILLKIIHMLLNIEVYIYIEVYIESYRDYTNQTQLNIICVMHIV